MLMFYIGSVVFSLIFVVVAFLVLYGYKKNEDPDAEEFFENKYFVTAAVIGSITIAFCPVVNIMAVVVVVGGFIASL